MSKSKPSKYSDFMSSSIKNVINSYSDDSFNKESNK